MANFGLGQIGNSTPRWAKMFFRVYFFTSKAFIGWGTATNIIDKEVMNNITLAITLFVDPILYGFSRMFGLTPDEIEIQKQEDVANAKA